MLPRDGGFVTVEYLVAVALSLLVLVVVANFIVWEYGRGVVGSAVDEGARAGSRAPAPEANQLDSCEQAADREITDLLGGANGSMGRGVSISCSLQGNQLVVNAEAHFAAWFPAMGGWTFSTKATAIVEPSG